MLLLIFLLGLLYGPVLGYYGLQIDSRDKSRLWPKNQDGFNSVGYCFDNEASQNDLADVISKGWAVWYNKLRAPGPDSSHALDFFRRFQTGGEWPYCHLPDGRWNPAFPGDTLVVKKAGIGAGTSATVGYHREGPDGRHFLELSFSPDDFEHLHVWTVTHELGLVFGLWHEHARPDRSHWIQFSCAKLVGYDAALAAAQRDGYSQNDLCNTHAVAERYGFVATEYMSENEPGTSMSAIYDTSSIMHYWSKVFANPDLIDHDPYNPDAYPLAILLDGSKYLIPEPMPQFAVSDLDAVALRKMYPWQGHGAEIAKGENVTTLKTVVRAAKATGGI
ncbi:hypothetical protein BKA63DRAFT_492723 [Paraphoma chrysanthemicola]|nr:hypothetical protein BKA63DRAFT_492723 [Paraphoma chrysanthemicola]